MVCEYDPLRDDGVVFAKSLETCGVPVELDVVEKAFHGFDNLDTQLSRTVRSREADFLRKHLMR